MGRLVAGILAALLLVTGVVVMVSGKAEQPLFAAAPTPRLAAPATAAPVRLAPIGSAPSADPKSKEEKRFDRSDKNKDGTITLAELVEPRRKPFAKLDLDKDGKLSFEEWAVKTIDKFEGAGVHYWASPVEAKLCRTQEVALVGAGNSAGQAVVYLASHAAKVWMLVRGTSLATSMSRY